jgi:uncharacterized metal-binding protein (TIGR02443 family)
MAIKKQFIAGAHCPFCNKMDTVKRCTEGEKEWIECVACGRSEVNPQSITKPEHPAEEVRVISIKPA